MQTTKVLSLLIVLLLSSCKSQPDSNNAKDPISNKISIELPDKIWHIYQDQKDNYWFGSNGDGLFFYDGNSLKQFTTEDGLVSNSIRAIQEDHLGNIFIGTPRGISKYDGKIFTTLDPIVSASNKWKLEPNDLWFNCNGNANDIYRYDGESLFELTLPRKDLNKAFGEEVKGLSFEGMSTSPYSVFGIDKDRKENLWVGTIVAGAFRYDGASFLWIAEKELTTLPDGRVPGVRSMIEDKDGNMWLSNFISKYKIDDQVKPATYEKLEGIYAQEFQGRLPYFNSGLADDKGNLWMTTYTGGVWRYDGKKLTNFPVNKVSNFPVEGGSTEALLVSIYKDNKGTLWLGTDNAGIFKFNGESFERFEPGKN